MELSEEVRKSRKPGHKINALILNRWSPRAMTGEGLTDEELMPLFEAARWAPSSFNNQPWRFLYSKRNSGDWDLFLSLLGDWNRAWANRAAVLVVAISRKDFEHNGKPSVTHAFDAGAAWENLALEGSSRGLVVHGMEGFDYAKAKGALGVPDNYEVHAMIAIGKRAEAGVLEDPKMREGEKPSGRRPLSEIAIEGRFKGK